MASELKLRLWKWPPDEAMLKGIDFVRKETTNDTPEDVLKGATKLDAGKSPIFRGFVSYFPRAIEAVADVSRFGHEKYGEWGGWRNVSDGYNRYLDADLRHLLSEAKGEVLASDSRLRHLAHKAWCAMAVLELELIEEEKNV